MKTFDINNYKLNASQIKAVNSMIGKGVKISSIMMFLEKFFKIGADKPTKAIKPDTFGVIKVVPYMIHKNIVNGARCSALSVPSGKREDWERVQDGWTWLNTATNKKGCYHLAVSTFNEAVKDAKEINELINSRA